MKRLHAFALCALVTPAITLGAGSVLAQSGTQATDPERQGMQRDEMERRTDRPGQSESQAAGERGTTGDLSRMGQTYMDSAPANGVQASNLIGAEVTTANDESIGEVNDLIIGEDGRVAAIVVSVGGFLGIGEKDVAIGWDHVTRSGTSGDQEMRVDMTREDLESAPEFEMQDE